jgi:hypothetical protein
MRDLAAFPEEVKERDAFPHAALHHLEAGRHLADDGADEIKAS